MNKINRCSGIAKLFTSGPPGPKHFQQNGSFILKVVPLFRNKVNLMYLIQNMLTYK